jgi:hypothetical protein
MVNLYTITVPQFIKRLGALKIILTKAEAFAKEKGVDETAFLNDTFAPDMFPLKRQVQLASDLAKGGAARLSGKESPKMEDTEATFAELQTRIDKTVAYLNTVKEEDFKGAEERHIALPRYPGTYFMGENYALEFSIPNFLFHVTTAYDLIRKNGVELSKEDYLSGLTLKDL